MCSYTEVMNGRRRKQRTAVVSSYADGQKEGQRAVVGVETDMRRRVCLLRRE